jgi:phage gpG-like protein
MAATMRITLTGVETVKASIDGGAARLQQAVNKAMGKSLDLVYRRVMANLTGAVLKVQTGRLRQSIQTIQTDTSGTIGTNVEYAAIHEFGGTTKAHPIAARGKALRFVDSRFIGPVKVTRRGISKTARSGVVFVRSVKHPGSVMPARPFMRPALRDSMPEINELFRTGVAAALGKK